MSRSGLPTLLGALAVIIMAGALVFWLGAGHRPPAEPVFTAEPAPAPAVPSRERAGQKAPSVTKVAAATPADRAKLQVLNEILAAKNDNDPRLDTDFKQLSEGSKALIRERYRGTPTEKRNERGTMIFLLGRNLATSADIAFMSQVLTEEPCLSMSDCGRADPSPGAPAEHHETGLSTTLVYPQLMALASIEHQLDTARPAPDVLAEIGKTIDVAARYPVPSVAQKARAVREKLNRSG